MSSHPILVAAMMLVAATLPPGGTFTDDDGSPHEPDIEAIAATGITLGCDTHRYCPDQPVTRAQIATLLTRALGLTPPDHTDDRFTDDDGSPHEPDIEAIAATGITLGCDTHRYCPDQPVTRAQIATLLTRALGLTPPDHTDDRFTDDDGSPHEPDIEAIAATGITLGCDTHRYCPDQPVTRAQIASLLARGLGLEPLAPPPGFFASIRPIDQALAARMADSWRPGCPVGLGDLRHLELDHWDLDGIERRGELVVHAEWADEIVGVFRALFQAGFPIERMVLVDEYGADDLASMEANNTSGFNCRLVDGTATWSQHASGLAIDINPVQNPFVVGDDVSPAAGRAYLDRSLAAPGMITAGDVATTAFESIGWGWGGTWTNAKDYQHFSASGG